MGEVQIFTAHRPHHQLRRPIWVIAPICLIIAFLICTFKFRPRSSSTCYVSSKTCKGISVWVPPAPFREYTDEGIASWIVIRHILYAPLVEPKIAFLFLSSGSLPFRDALGRGHEGRFSIHVHALKDGPVHTSNYFVDREICRDRVGGTCSI